MPNRRKNKLFYRVMVVEDDPDIRTLLRVVLGKSWAFNIVAEAHDGEAAIQLASEGIRSQVDVILLDLLMPGMGGREAFPHLRELCPGVKIVILTVVPELCREIPGHDGCIDKSLLPSDMIFELYRALNPTTTLTKEDINAP